MIPCIADKILLSYYTKVASAVLADRVYANYTPSQYTHPSSRVAPRVLAEGGVAEIYADYISYQAYDLLIDANIKVRYGKKVDHATFLDIWKRLGEGE